MIAKQITFSVMYILQPQTWHLLETGLIYNTGPVVLSALMDDRNSLVQTPALYTMNISLFQL